MFGTSDVPDAGSGSKEGKSAKDRDLFALDGDSKPEQKTDQFDFM